MVEPEDRTEAFSSTTVTPADRFMAELPGLFYRLSEVAEMLGVSEKTLRRLIRKGVTDAPSKKLVQGGMQMYLYTPADVQELKEYYKKGPDGEDRK